MMLFPIAHKQTLLYSDGPRLIVGSDKIGTTYLCQFYDLREDAEEYICVAVSADRLMRVRTGEIPVREALLNSEQGCIFLAAVTEDGSDQLFLSPISIDRINLDWLPSPNFRCKREPDADTEILATANATRRLVIDFALDVPEAKYEPRITTLHLAEGVARYQSLIKQCFRKSIRRFERKAARLIDIEDNWLMDVCALGAHRSFSVQLQSRAEADWTNHIELKNALAKIDEIAALMESPEKAVAFLRENRGRMAVAYKNMLKYVVETRASVVYEWATPGLTESVRHRISTDQAFPLYNELLKIKDIDIEPRTIVGFVSDAGNTKGEWTIRSEEDGDIYSGRFDTKKAVNLAGVTLEIVKYRFNCEERIREDAMGRQFPELWLIGFEPLT